MIHRYTRVKYKGKVYRVQLSGQDAMTRSFSHAVSNAVASAKQNGNPVARYDRQLRKSYLEYPDGHKVYRDET